MPGMDILVSKAGSVYNIVDIGTGRYIKRASEPSSLASTLYYLRNDIENIETRGIDELGSSSIMEVLSDFEFHNLEDESGNIQRYLDMASEFSKGIYSNPAGRTALLRSAMERKLVSVKREEGCIAVRFPSPDGQEKFERIGDAVIGLKKYLERHEKDFPKPPFEIYSELDDGPGGEGYKLKDALRGLYTFKGIA
jgi:hypothetical protein